MPIRYSNVVGGSGGTGFNLDVGSSGNTTFYFDTPQPAGGYSITSQLADSSIEFYAIAEDGTLAGYTNTKALSATKDFDTLVVYGATNNDLITFEYKSTTLPTASGDQDSGAAPFITSVSDADLANIDDTTIITGGNFATDVTVTFTGTDAVVRNAKSVVRTNSTQLIVTRPDDFLEDNSPYTLTVSNPGITQSAIKTYTSSITAGGDPVWITAPDLPSVVAGNAYTATVQATEPDGDSITYSVVSGMPAGLSLNSQTGELSGAASAGNYTITISASDSSGNTTNRAFVLTVGAASGGTISSSNDYVIHTFTEDDTFIVGQSLNVEYLIVAGGGAGGDFFDGGGYNAAGGGGGAGGVLTGTTTLSPNSYPVNIGAAGVSTATSNSSGGYAANGGNSSALGLTAIGGGRGGAGNSSASGNAYVASSGGSGGGGVRPDGGASYSNAGAGTSGQGNAGGNYSTSGNDGMAGGGGGAGGAGQVGGQGSNGGPGIVSSITGTSVTYAGGGGGGRGNTGTWSGTGGSGGGGNGGGKTTNSPGNDATGYGSGGGGAGSSPSAGYFFKGGNGSPGIVVIRYQP